VQYACWVTEQVDYVGEDTIQLLQSIYLYGDWKSFR